MCRQAGLLQIDENTKRNRMYAYQLRSFFRTNFARLEDARARDVTETLLGHYIGQDKSYFNIPESEIAELYVKGEKYVTIFNRPIENRAIIEQQQKEINELKTEMAKINEFREEVDRMWKFKDSKEYKQYLIDKFSEKK